jgi:phosphoglycerol transferase MdoB-like AlkP superfamily enzyme
MIGIYFVNIFAQERKTGGIYNLYFETNNISLNIERLGVMAATVLDVERSVFGFNEKILEVNLFEEDNSFSEYDYNVLELDLNNENENIEIINNYVMNEFGTRKNEYTGMFENMNLIFIVAESFSEIAVSEELTPTLYKLVHDGFYFKNYYTSNNLSTIGGEFQALTGLYADNSLLSNWRSGSAYFPYGIGTMFSNQGYKTYAYHNNDAFFQDRNVYLKTQGLSNYIGCNNGMEELIDCNIWPQSDVEMISQTYDDYMYNDEQFLTYYMTVSGHFYYSTSANSIAAKNQDYVNHLDYNEDIRGYLATQIELDMALELLLDKLEESGKLDNTVIVLTADHYPYNLNINNINKLSDYERDLMIEANSNNLIIYNSKMTPVTIDKTAMSIDILPTILNLFGMEYDSRIIMGKDILSTTTGIAIFKDKSWVTDKGTYYASTGKFVGEDVSDEYIQNINNIVNNRTAISRMIVANDYYRKILG